MGGDAGAVVARIQDLERRGIQAAWLTTGGVALDALTVFAAVAVKTERIMLGTCITPTWPRHPIVAVQQVQAVAGLAPGRFRLGLGPAHKPSMEEMFGFEFKTPLTNLREYVQIVKSLLREGSVDFDGRHYHAHGQIAQPFKDVPIMVSALRLGSYEFSGAETDGAISWVSPYVFLRDAALPAMRAGAERAGRPVPPLVAHVPICVSDDPDEGRVVARQQFSYNVGLPFYAQMLSDAGFPEVKESAAWSDAMLDAVVLLGDEEDVAKRLRELFDWGISEVIAQPLMVGESRQASWDRTVDLLASVAGTL